MWSKPCKLEWTFSLRRPNWTINTRQFTETCYVMKASQRWKPWFTCDLDRKTKITKSGGVATFNLLHQNSNIISSEITHQKTRKRQTAQNRRNKNTIKKFNAESFIVTRGGRAEFLFLAVKASFAASKIYCVDCRSFSFPYDFSC